MTTRRLAMRDRVCRDGEGVQQPRLKARRLLNWLRQARLYYTLYSIYYTQQYDTVRMVNVCGRTCTVLYVSDE